MPTLPTITVVTPSFNQAQYLERAIRSVLDQGYADLEYMVFDGGSTDGSVEVIRRYGSRLRHWVSAKDNGQAAAINAGWRMAGGQILGWLNSDDYYLPGALASVAEYFVTHRDALWLYGRCLLEDQAGRHRGVMGDVFDLKRMLHGYQPMAQPSTFIRRELIDSVGWLDESLHYSMDYDFFLRAARVRSPDYIDRDLAAFTIHPEGKTTSGRRRSRSETRAVGLRYATGADRVIIRALALRSAVFYSLPRPISRAIDLVRRPPLG